MRPVAVLLHIQSGFVVDWDPPSIRILDRSGKTSRSKGDFAIKLDQLVEAGAQTGYMAWVKRAIDFEERCVFGARMIQAYSLWICIALFEYFRSELLGLHEMLLILHVYAW